MADLSKSVRVLMMLHDLLDGKKITRIEIEEKYEIPKRQFERDIQTIRQALDEGSKLSNYPRNVALVYDRAEKVYHLTDTDNRYFSNAELLSLLKVILESRAFCKNEKDRLISVLLNQVSKTEYSSVKRLIENENHLYEPLQHNKELFQRIWDLSCAVNEQKNLKIKYKRADEKVVERTVSPLSIIFSEYYFYLMCYFPNKKTDNAISYRIDRIESYEVTKEIYQLSYHDRFQDGEHRKNVHYMYQGELLECLFEFTGHSHEAVLDRFPDSEIVDKQDNKYILKVRAKEQGLIMWILSQGSSIKVLSPESLVDKMQAELDKMRALYNQ